MNKQKQINWLNTAFLCLSPVAAITALILYLYHFGFHWFDVGMMVFMFALTGLSVTGGYHRLFSHRTYEATWLVRFFYVVFGAAALQNSVLMWCSDHRDHHTYTDTDRDPYNIQKGFMWAHMGWIFFEEERPKDFKNSPDLLADPLVQWQHKYYFAIGILSGFVFPALLGYWLNGPMGAWSGFVWGGLVRTVLIHHSTFLVNSAAHWFGSKTYSSKVSARDNYFLAFFTNGEGYHNYHHVFPNDYRNGIAWYNWDPTKWIVYVLSKLGLTSDLKRVPEWTIVRAKMRREMESCTENLNVVPETLSESFKREFKEIKSKVNGALLRLSEVEKEIQTLKTARRSGEILREIYRQRKRELKGYQRKLLREIQEFRGELGKLQLQTADFTA